LRNRTQDENFDAFLYGNYNVIPSVKSMIQIGTVMRTRIVKIGNSPGIRIPKPLLEQSGIEEEVKTAIKLIKTSKAIAFLPKDGYQSMPMGTG
jgi:hypothetical protein